MIFSIAGPKIIHQYNNLKQSKQEININTTTKQMDEYVYDKNGGLKNLGLAGSILLADVLIYNMLNNDNAFKNSPKILKTVIGAVSVLLNIYAGKVVYDSEKIKQAKLNNSQEKLKLYREKGLNAVI